ncbi:MAG: hypothetical protein IKH65_04355, partial [Clostridia bacterium]|nr:hypothetical protein [Clostridia bacterium]
MRRRKIALLAVLTVIAIAFSVFATTAFADEVLIAPAPDSSSAFTIGEGEDAVDYDLEDGDSALAYVESYADNLSSDENFKSHIDTALAKVRESVGSYATFLSLLPPIIAILLALITKEVYSSLIIGVIVGAVIYSGGNFEG